MLPLDRGTKAYVAAIIDAIGIIRIRETRAGTALPYVGVNSTNFALLNMLGGITDAKITTVVRKGQRYTKPGKDNGEDVYSYRWGLTGAKATVLLHNIRPYLFFKTSEADVALLAGLQAEYKPATPNRMARIGWELPPTLIKVPPASPKITTDDNPDETGEPA